MYSYKFKKLPKSTVEINLVIPLSDIQKEKSEAFSRLQKELTVEGFRKGKVPLVIAEKHLSPEAIYQEMIRVFLPKVYEEILKKESFKPIMNPRIELIKAKEGEDWEVKISIAEKPIVDLKNYKDAVKKIKIEAKKEDIWIPGKDKVADEKKSEQNKSKLINPILEVILKEVKVEISDLIIDEELNHRLSRLVDDVEKIGLTAEAYLKSKNLTMDQLKANYKREIEDTYKLEFILAEIADKESIKVEKEDLEKLLRNIKDEKERALAMQNSYYYASILRKQKTLDYLIGL
ncbi:MAG: Trigger factor [Candidatus Roizmanbacteria bacterium GW2011_GWC2_37_13]|uniref:Trigger factor n=1 Tax=Candidatus Roizmanbacteria bacterium GW2011_GWC2_37_13 TaxID=1618486 RepID=A0A0G0G6Q1_9BACT|nr:MAG: Trigger factor [Candidatus Roizmanbacteria bacterium GW2011_GWC1_37_12]KKQ25722.1 MAG: Trigger factor [Candidatus Roizmanbacteria bacterium GW2011_GWC2_37_13]